MQDVQSRDVGHRSCREPNLGPARQQCRISCLTRHRTKFFRIIQQISQFGGKIPRKNNGRRHHWSGQRPTPHLIHAYDASAGLLFEV